MAEPEVATPGSERPRTPGFATDLALLGLQGSTVDVRDDYLVVRTPVNPTFHWGNCLVLDRAPLAGSLESWLAVFAGEHPGAAHVAMGIDDPDTVVDPAEARALGLSVERDVVRAAAAYRKGCDASYGKSCVRLANLIRGGVSVVTAYPHSRRLAP